jgi:DNA-binding response OmpR family regulator
MLRKEGVVISREELLLNIGSIHYESSLKSIDVIIGRLFLIAQEHFKKQQQTAQLHRFLLAGQLLHTQSDANTSNLTSLKIKVANIQT